MAASPTVDIPRLSSSRRNAKMKVTVFALSWVLAHVGRCLEIARALRARGHEVVFAGDDPDHPMSFLRHVKDDGFRVVHVREPKWHWAWKRFHDHGAVAGVWDFFNHGRWAPLDLILEDMLRVVDEEEPDLLLGDASIGVSTVGRIAQVKAAGVLNAYNLKFFQPWGLYRGLIRACDRFKWAPVRRRVYRHHGATPANAIELLETIPLLAPDLPIFHDPRATYPNWTPIGPLVYEPRVPLPSWYEELSDGTPNVYITMGSTGLLDPLLKRTFAELAKLPYRFIVTGGKQISADTLAAAPPNFRFAAYAPGSKLLEHSAALVFHGGNGTMYQALAAGVPMLALPSHLEQEASITPALEHGFARRGHARKITGKQLAREVELLVNDISYRANARRFRRHVREAGAAENAADILEQHVLGAVSAGNRKAVRNLAGQR